MAKTKLPVACLNTLIAVAATVVVGALGWAAIGGSPRKASSSTKPATAKVAGAPQAAGVGVAAAPNAPTGADKEAIRTWLRENLGEPKWEEIKWYPAVSNQQIGHNLLQLLRQGETPLGSSITANQHANRWLQSPACRFCVVKLRAKWILGVPSVQRKLFRIANGKAELWGYFDEYWLCVPQQDRGLVTDP